MEIVIVVVLVAVAYAVQIFLLCLLSRDARRHEIYLSRTTRIFFIISFTAPFALAQMKRLVDYIQERMVTPG